MTGNDRKMTGNDREWLEIRSKWPKMTGNDWKLAQKWPGMTENDRKMTENDRKMTGNGPEMTENDRKMTGNDREWLEIRSKWPKMTGNDWKLAQKWPGMTGKWPDLTWKWLGMTGNPVKMTENDREWLDLTWKWLEMIGKCLLFQICLCPNHVFLVYIGNKKIFGNFDPSPDLKFTKPKMSIHMTKTGFLFSWKKRRALRQATPWLFVTGWSGSRSNPTSYCIDIRVILYIIPKA